MAKVNTGSITERCIAILGTRMNTNPKAKRVFLYGDSFVFGKVGGKNERFDFTQRFSGVLQKIIGSNYEIIEEGLRARTLSGENGFFEQRDGLEQFGPILGSHLPLDVIVIMLGTNDFNSKSSKSLKDIQTDLQNYDIKIKEWCEFLEVSIPKVLLISPPKIKPEFFDDGQKTIFGKEASRYVAQLPDTYNTEAHRHGWSFFDANTFCQAGEADGVHLDIANNLQIAKAMSLKIKDLVT